MSHKSWGGDDPQILGRGCPTDPGERMSHRSWGGDLSSGSRALLHGPAQPWLPQVSVAPGSGAHTDPLPMEVLWTGDCFPVRQIFSRFGTSLPRASQRKGFLWISVSTENPEKIQKIHRKSWSLEPAFHPEIRNPSSPCVQFEQVNLCLIQLQLLLPSTTLQGDAGVIFRKNPQKHPLNADTSKQDGAGSH